jgi:predicted Zn-dependent peptidase
MGFKHVESSPLTRSSYHARQQTDGADDEEDEYRLKNGLRVLMFPDQTKQTITVNMTYLVGSRHENYGETGMAHLLEHMVFKGTPRHPNIPAGAHFARRAPERHHVDDRTNYFETFAATTRTSTGRSTSKPTA